MKPLFQPQGILLMIIAGVTSLYKHIRFGGLHKYTPGASN